MTFQATRSCVVCVIALISAAIALAVMWGWVDHSLTLVRFIPGSAPMQFNTALIILLLSIALPFMEKGYPATGKMFAAIAMGLAGVTLCQYILRIDFGIDTLFVKPFTQVNSAAIGRMAPNSALALVLLSISILLSDAHRREFWIFFSLLMASLAAALGLVPLLGYVSDIKAAYGWENFARMAIHTAALLVFLGSAAVIRNWRYVPPRTIWLPLAVAIGLLVVTISMAVAVHNTQERDIDRRLKSDAQNIALETTQELEDLDRALARIANRWKVGQGTNQTLWKGDVGVYLKDMPALTAFLRLDAKGDLLWSVKSPDSPSIPAEWQQHLNPGTDADSLVPLPLGHRGLVWSYPLEHNGKSDGQMVVIIDTHRLLQEIADRVLPDPINVEAQQGETLLYLHFKDVLSPRRASATLQRYPVDWKWTVYATPTLEMQYTTRMPWVVLGLGVMTTFLSSISLYLLQRQRGDMLRFKEGKARLRAVFENAADGIALSDDRGIIEEFNPACETLFGYRKEEVRGQSVKLLMPEPYRGEHDGYMQHHRDTGERRIIGLGREVKGRRKDGSEFDIDLRISEVQLPDRKLYMGMFHDITARKQAEATQAKLMAKLAESNTDLERFAYVASHDLREPLRIIANFATLFGDEVAEMNDTAQQYLGIIQESASRMHAMVSDLLEYARIGNDEKRHAAVDMQLETQHVTENLNASIKEHQATVKFQNLPTLPGNPVQLMRLMQNLVGNAIKFHAEGVKPVVEIRAKANPGHWEFSVTDNGIGMEPQYIQQIFEPFRQLHGRNEYMGTGIGLAICKRIVEKHQGTIWAESQLGAGSTFYFTLPK